MHTEPWTFEVGRPDHLDELVTLVHAVAATLPNSQMLCVDDRPFFAKLLGPEGHVLLVRREDGMLVGAATALFPDQSDPENLGRDLGFPHNLLPRVLHLESAYILPEARGSGFAQMLSGRQIQLAAAMGRDYVFATAWPGNGASLATLTHLGLTVRALSVKYGGMERFILLRTPQPPIFIPQEEKLVPALAFQQHADLLEQGFAGTRVLRQKTPGSENPWDFQLAYHKLAETPS